MASYLLTSPSSTLSIPKLATFSSNHRPLFLRTQHRSPPLCHACPKWRLSAASEAPSYEPVEVEEGDVLEGSEMETTEFVEAGDVLEEEESGLPDSVEMQIAEFEAVTESTKRDKGEDVYAVVMIGSRQYIVYPGRYLNTQRLKGANVNDKIILNKVLLVGTRDKYYIGQPIVTNAAVHAVVEEQGKDPKVIIMKYKRKKNYRRKIGHRQPNTRLRIIGISGYEGFPAD
ncbi:50S ribosomal protein L21 [Rhynchospora pubera]|uniref:50S ribosomal protein L21 n=1 Tax=Rhynchospora pubera TaxID=906938 RepID=A0AAV8DV07_9POAL|nr:50S ribosomal protein L21 [Rhynchospora pubera]